MMFDFVLVQLAAFARITVKPLRHGLRLYLVVHTTNIPLCLPTGYPSLTQFFLQPRNLLQALRILDEFLHALLFPVCELDSRRAGTVDFCRAA